MPRYQQLLDDAAAFPLAAARGLAHLAEVGGSYRPCPAGRDLACAVHPATASGSAYLNDGTIEACRVLLAHLDDHPAPALVSPPALHALIVMTLGAIRQVVIRRAPEDEQDEKVRTWVQGMLECATLAALGFPERSDPPEQFPQDLRRLRRETEFSARVRLWGLRPRYRT